MSELEVHPGLAAGRRATRYSLEDVKKLGVLIGDDEECVRECLVPGAALLVNAMGASACFVVLTTEHSPDPWATLAKFAGSLGGRLGPVDVFGGESWACLRYVNPVTGQSCCFVPFLAYDSTEHAAEMTHAVVLDCGGTATATGLAICTGGGSLFAAPDAFISCDVGPAVHSWLERPFRCPRQLPELYPDAELIMDELICGDMDLSTSLAYVWPVVGAPFRVRNIGRLQTLTGLVDELRSTRPSALRPRFLLHDVSLLPCAFVHERALMWLAARRLPGSATNIEFTAATGQALKDLWDEEVEKCPLRAEFARPPLPVALDLGGRRCRLRRWTAACGLDFDEAALEAWRAPRPPAAPLTWRPAERDSRQATLFGATR